MGPNWYKMCEKLYTFGDGRIEGDAIENRNFYCNSNRKSTQSHDFALTLFTGTSPDFRFKKGGN